MATSAESRRHVGLADVLSALPDFCLPATFLITWVRPLAFGDRMVAYLMLVMLLEFIVVHSAGFMGSAAMGSGDRRKGAVFYLVFVGITTVLPLPKLGITAAVVSAQELPGEGLWIEQPHRVIAFGFLYFSAWGISELYAHRWAAGGTPAAA